jgi:hypothetical protein
MKKVNGYFDFVNESQFELLLEANIQYLPRFKNILAKIDTKISTELIKLIDTEVDINTNYIDIDDNKNFIKFVPDDRVKELTYIMSESDANHSLHYCVNNYPRFYQMDNNILPTSGAICTIVKTFKKGEIDNLFTGSNRYYNYNLNDVNIFCHVKFTYMDDGPEEGNAIVLKSTLIPCLSDYKSMEFKIGKFASSMLKKAGVEFTNVELEDFVNKYKAQIEIRQGLFDRFEIVKGEDIRRYYLHTNYNSQNGSLGNSCMKYRRCQSYLDIYVQNSNVSMLILNGTHGILGRAIMWVDTKDRKIMDRIYTNNSADEELFKEYAKKNEFYYKASQDYVAMGYLMLNDDVIKDPDDITIMVQLDEKGVDYDYYPFMDTVKFMNIELGIISNNPNDGYDYELESTTGYHDCDMCNGRENVDCPECNNGRVECEDCNGNGEVECEFCEGNPVSCPDCDGENPDCEFCEGEPVICPECDGETLRCSDCNGSGTTYCSDCDGDGEVTCPVCTLDN